MLISVPLGWDYFPTICFTILGIWLLILLVLIFARFSLKIKENWVWAVLVYSTIITAILNISEPMPTFAKVQENNNPVDKYFLVVCTAFMLFIVMAFVHSWQKHYEFKRSQSTSEKLLLRREKLVSWALFSWCAAFLLYFIGYYYSGTQRSMLTSLLRPAVSASKIFILADNPMDATLAFRRSGLFMGLLSLIRLSGFLVSAQIVIHLLGSRIRSFTRIRLAHCTDSSLYIFFNINSASIQLAKTIARNVHDVWAQSRISEGWTYGEQRNDEKRQTPCLIDYDHLSEEEKAYDRNTSIETLRLIMKLGFKITKDN